VATVSGQQPLELWGEGRWHSGSHLDQLVAMARQLERNRQVVREHLVRFQQLGDHDTELFREGLNRFGFRSKTRHVVARGDPDADFRVPIRLDVVDVRSHDAASITHRFPRSALPERSTIEGMPPKWHDLIVAEVRRAREALFAEANYDILEFCRRLSARQETSGHPVVKRGSTSVWDSSREAVRP